MDYKTCRRKLLKHLWFFQAESLSKLGVPTIFNKKAKPTRNIFPLTQKWNSTFARYNVNVCYAGVGRKYVNVFILYLSYF